MTVLESAGLGDSPFTIVTAGLGDGLFTIVTA